MTKKPTNVYSLLNPSWITEESDIYYDESFWEIISFYVIHSFCKGQSNKGVTLQETYSWKENPWSPTAYLKDKLDMAIWGGERISMYMADTRAEFKNKLDGRNLDNDFCNDLYNQRACFVKQESYGAYMSFFHHLRNGLAHGRFGMCPISENDYMIFIEDGKDQTDVFEVTARIAIKKSSLLKIEEIIKSGPEIELDYGTDIVESIRDGKNTKRKIIKDLNITENIWKKESLILRQAGIIKFERKKWIVISEEGVQ